MYHVLAKRYLCTVDNNYFNSLSQASQQSFIIQDGYLDKFSLELINNKMIIVFIFQMPLNYEHMGFIKIA